MIHVQICYGTEYVIINVVIDTWNLHHLALYRVRVVKRTFYDRGQDEMME